MNGLALQIEEALRRDPHAGDLYVFRGARGNLIKIFGMTASACRSTPKGWRGAASSAVAERRYAGDLCFAACLHARRNRLAKSGSYLPTGAGGIIAWVSVF